MQPKIEHSAPLNPFDSIKPEQESLVANPALGRHHPLTQGPGQNSNSQFTGLSNNLNLHSQQAHNSQPRPHYRHSGSFTGLAFHNPFDMNSYPITNPPILDSTVIPYEQGTRHRRISISNGQIGQIVNHEAFFMDEDLFDDLNDLSPYPAPQNSHHTSAALLDQRIMLFDVETSQPHSLLLHQQQYTQVPAPPQGPVVTSAHQQHAPRTHFRTDQENDTLVSNLNSSTTAQVDAQSQDVAGVPPPNHQLFYNNEVIYNPNNGPIPGTAAWKKERLLERNRIAASKCRQRKKHAQQELQDNMNKSQNKIKAQAESLNKYEKLFALYNSALAQHFDDKLDASLEPLRKFISKLIEDISLSDLEK